LAWRARGDEITQLLVQCVVHVPHATGGQQRVELIGVFLVERFKDEWLPCRRMRGFRVRPYQRPG